jgi:hypothetical protein
MSIECWKCGSELTNSTSPHPCSEFWRPESKASDPVCYCGHLLIRHHGPLGSNMCLDLNCKNCSGYIDVSTPFGARMAKARGE